VGQKPAAVRTRIERNGQMSAVRSDIRKRKALDWLIERVELVDGSGKTIDRAELELEPEPGASDPDEAPTEEDE
jgi:trigger factor